MKALVFAAGLGTRLRPLTLDRPKALIEVGGRPLLYHVIDKLRRSGVTSFVVNAHHFSDMIEDYLRGEDFLGMDISVSVEKDYPRETGGGILMARNLLESGESIEEGFLVHNVDILSNLDVGGFVREAKSRQGSLSTIVVSPRRTQRYFLFDEDLRLVGWRNVSTGEVRTPYPDLEVEKCKHLAFAGMHFISPDIFDAFGRYPGFDDKFSIVDFYIKACRDYPIYGVVQPGFKLFDVGKIETLDGAEIFLQELDAESGR